MKKCAFIIGCLMVAMFAKGQSRPLLPDTLSLCQGDSGFVELKQSVDKDATVSWRTPQGIITNTKRIPALAQGKYYVKVSSPLYTPALTDSCYVRVSRKLKPLMRDTLLCKGKTLLLDCGYAGLRYTWSTGETGQRITVSEPGRYWVKIRNGNCTLADTVKVRSGSQVAIYTAPEVNFCLNEEHKTISVRASPGAHFIWSTGATTYSTSITHEGTYWVRTELAPCGSQSDTIRVKMKPCECEMMIPNSFTPNEDNRNDYFFPVAQCEYSYFNMTITDRWGNTVYASNNLNGRWDGRFKGNLCPEDIYIYRIESTERGSEKKQVRNGRISLFR